MSFGVSPVNYSDSDSDIVIIIIVVVVFVFVFVFAVVTLLAERVLFVSCNLSKHLFDAELRMRDSSRESFINFSQSQQSFRFSTKCL